MARLFVRLLPIAGLLAAAVLFSWQQWRSPSWTADSVYYLAQSHELTGANARAERLRLFLGPVGRRELLPDPRFTDRRWINWTSRLYRRRWLVPALAVVVRPIAGIRALEVVSLIGYALSGLLLYALARLRFGRRTAFAAAAAALWFPPYADVAAMPMTDTMGVAAIAAAMLAGVWAFDGSRPRLVVWAAAVLALAFAHDTGVIAAAAALSCAVFMRTRRAYELAAVAIAAAAPVSLFMGDRVQDTMALAFNGREVPPSTSWSFIIPRYLPNLSETIRIDWPVWYGWPLLLAGVAVLGSIFVPGDGLRRLRQIVIGGALAAFVVLALIGNAPFEAWQIRDPLQPAALLLVAVVPLFLPGRRRDPLLLLLRGGFVGAMAFQLVQPQPTNLRIAVVLVPFAVFGVARAVTEASRLVSFTVGDLLPAPLLARR